MNQILVVLAPPRSFTSIVSAMIGQHSQMYGLAETHLFCAETISEWWQECNVATFDMDHGLRRVVAELFFGRQTEITVSRASGWLRRRSHFTTGLIFEELARKVHPRIAVDKSPTTVLRLESMQRVYCAFPQARFLHLVRHPRGYGESVMRCLDERKKLGPLPPKHWLLSLAACPSLSAKDVQAGNHCSDLDPQRSWYALHINICEFLHLIPEAQKLRIRGEDLLTDCEQSLVRLATWLGLRTDSEAIEEMRHPERSPYACFGPASALLGNDRSFLRNPALRPERGRLHALDGPLSWREDGEGFLSEVKKLATAMGYQ